MRLNKILALSAAVAALTTAALAQVVTYGPSQVSFGNIQVDVAAPERVADLVIDITPNADFWNAEPSQVYAYFAIRLAYDPSKIELQFFSGGNWVNVSSLAVNSTRNLSRGPGYFGTASLGRKADPNGLVVVELGLANAGNDNTRLSGTPLGTGSGASFRPLRWDLSRLNLFETYTLPDFAGSWGETKYGQIAKLATDETPNQRSFFGLPEATFTVVPEPASMIALGSGLVGLLALRRRRAN